MNNFTRKEKAFLKALADGRSFTFFFSSTSEDLFRVWGDLLPEHTFSYKIASLVVATKGTGLSAGTLDNTNAHESKTE